MKIANVKVVMVIIKFALVTIWEYNLNQGTLWLKIIMLYNVQINMHAKETKYNIVLRFLAYSQVIYIKIICTPPPPQYYK